ncbi:MAG: M28 family peptidase, partial [Pseudomonadota bacterium]|nr:M28 family peptidase [Pseudomonadota bacterium]
MRVEIVELHPDAVARPAADPRASGELRFGNTIVRLGAAALPIAEATVAGRRTAEVRESERLFVVVQKGRIFQQENPDVEVLLDHGRYLLVKLGASESARLQTPEEPCYAVMPATNGQVIYERLARPLRSRRQPLPRSICCRAKRSPRPCGSLTGLHSRFSGSAGYRQAIALCRESLENFGFETVEQGIEVPGFGPSSNLVARKAGSAPPAVLVTAHLDSVNIAGGPDALAPGADDDGSGSAGVVTLAQALAAADGADGADGVGFILFGGEEQDLLGSKHFVE